MRTIYDVDAEAFERTLRAARAASDAYDSESEVDLLWQVLTILSDDLSRQAEFHRETFGRVLRNASDFLARRILDTCLELAGALIKHAPFDAMPWIEFVAETLELETFENEAWLERMQVNLRASQGVLSVHLSESSPARTKPAPYVGTQPSGARTVQRLAQAMNHARRLAGEGDTPAAIALVNAELSTLDRSTPRADEIEQLAHLLIRELASQSYKVKRRCCRGAYTILRCQSSYEAVMMLLRAASYAESLDRRELVLQDQYEALCETNRLGAQALRWHVLNHMTESELGFGRISIAIGLSKLALREYQAVRQALEARDPQLAELTPLGELTIDRLVDLLVETGRLDEAEQVAQIRLAPDLGSTIPPLLTSRERSLEALLLELPSELEIMPKIDKTFADLTGHDIPSYPLSNSRTDVISLTFFARNGGLNCLLTVAEKTTNFDLKLHVREANLLAYRVRQAVLTGCSESNPVLRECFDKLLRRPLEQAPQGCTLRIGATGGLRNIPWAALHDGKSYLVQSYALLRSTAPVAKLNAAMASKIISVSFGASRGCPEFGELGQDVINEARAVAALASRGYVLVDEDFSLINVQRAMRTANIVHFVTHFILNPAVPANSGLLLGNGEQIPLEQLAGMCGGRLELMILSCCSSAIGGSEEDHSVEDFLVLGGVHAILGTIWKVDNAAMSLLVPVFVEGLRMGFNKAEALARAQRDMIEGNVGDGRLKLPCFFAGSVIAGDITPWPVGAFSG